MTLLNPLCFLVFSYNDLIYFVVNSSWAWVPQSWAEECSWDVFDRVGAYEDVSQREQKKKKLNTKKGKKQATNRSAARGGRQEDCRTPCRREFYHGRSETQPKPIINSTPRALANYQAVESTRAKRYTRILMTQFKNFSNHRPHQLLLKT